MERGFPSFDDFFEVLRAQTPDLLEQVYRLRYRVYCLEHAFEDPAQYPANLETDPFDAISEQVALVYRPTSEVIGTVRLVLPGQTEPPLPIFQVLGAAESDRLREYPRSQLAEISRYAVAKSFRRRLGESEYPDVQWVDEPAQANRRLSPHLTLGLMRAVLGISIARDIEYLCACMRPALLKLLHKAGLDFEPLGGLVNLHGARQPCIGSRSVLLDSLKIRHPGWYAIVNSPF